MRTPWIAAAALGVGLLTCREAAAGLYNTAEPMAGPTVGAEGVKPLGVSHFRSMLSEMLSVGVEQSTGAKRRHYLEQRDRLLARAGSTSVEDKVNLSEYVIRLREYEKAVELLTPLATREQANFMVFANLGTAHQLAGRPERALGYLEQVKDHWPGAWPGWSKAQLDWYRQAERYHLKLVRLRYREQVVQSRGGRPAAGLDELFTTDKGAVHYVGESGRYEAGKLAAQERAKLPTDALAVVQQLLLWVPGPAPGMEDARLYWQLGELYNAAGDVSAAVEVLDRCVWNLRYDAALLSEHRKVVQEAKPEAEPVFLPTTTPALPPPVERNTWTPNLRHIITAGCVAAVVVGGLIYLQVREMRRRRQSR
jgi:hypothetical protein